MKNREPDGPNNIRDKTNRLKDAWRGASSGLSLKKWARTMGAAGEDWFARKKFAKNPNGPKKPAAKPAVVAPAAPPAKKAGKKK